MAKLFAANSTAADLERLRELIAAFTAPEAQAQDPEPLLLEERRALARALAALHDDTDAMNRFAQIADVHRLLIDSGLRELPRDEEDQALADELRLRFAGGLQPAGPRLAAMLLFQAFELPLPPNLDSLPQWILPSFARFLLLQPRIFHQPGDGERNARFLDEAVGLLCDYILRQPPAPLSGALGQIFIEESRFIQAYFSEANLRRLYRNRARIIEHWLLANGAPLAQLFAPRNGARRLRVGILCQHFAAQTESYFTLAHIEHLPRERFDLRIYVFKAPADDLARYAAGLCDELVVLPDNDILTAAAQLRADDLDFLLIASNVTVAVNALSLLAHFRLARVQAISASSPVTSGMTSADWFLNAEYNETDDGARAQYTEQVYRMPGMLTRYAYQHDKDSPTRSAVRSDLGIPANALVYFSAANFFKIVPELSALWARLLAKVANAWLVLMPFGPHWSYTYLSQPFCARVLGQVRDAGGDPGQVLIMESVPTRADLHSAISVADIYLDSYPFAGACSLLDPLLVGLPVVARNGRCFRGSVGAGMLRGLGLADMAVDGEEAYLDRAVLLARDPALRKREGARVKAALSPHNPVYDSETGSRNLEAAITDLVSRSDAGDAALLRQPPQLLRQAIGRLSDALVRDANEWFSGINDVELVRGLIVPYFQGLPPENEPRRMLDVGACVGQMAAPFLATGWEADLFEPDPACEQSLADLAARHGGRVTIHRMAVAERDASGTSFYQSATGLSGLSPSPYAATTATLSVRSTRLDSVARSKLLRRVDFLKIDAEGWDFSALRSHDFETLPPRVAMVEFGTNFAQQDLPAVLTGIADMARLGYDALVFSYEDDGNFQRQLWRYRLIGAGFGAPVPRKDGHAAGNILFFRRDDALFLATVLRLFLGCLPARERTQHLASPPAGIDTGSRETA
jgi:FkbM family methyltransferase